MTYGIDDQSCEGAGMACVDTGTPVSCCEAKLVAGGTYLMGRGTSGSDAYTDQWVGADEQPEHEATVDGFMLDVFEVTVGRFRKFVEAYDGTPPPEGAGVHPDISGSGWQSA